MARVLPSLPTDGGNVNAWGPILNTALDHLRTKSLKVVDVTDYPGVQDSAVVSSQVGIEEAVTDALALGAPLTFPHGQYLAAANIPNLHSVVKRGPGRIVTGSSTFWMEPLPSQTNTLYVRAGGSDTNDGLTTGRAFATVARACTVLNGYGTLTGTWLVDIGAGSFAPGAVLDVTTENPVELVGVATAGHPAVPTTRIGTALGVSAVGIQVKDGTRAKFTDIEFYGLSGSTSSSGITASNRHDVYLINCHFTACYYGASSTNGALDVKGGIFTDCTGAGVRSLQLNRHSIGWQNAGTLAGGPIFRNCVAGVLAQENSTGHVDWSTFEDCDDGVLLRISSRANLDGSSFKRCDRGVRADSSSHFFPSQNTWGTGADVNGTPWVTTSGAEVTTTEMVTGLQLAYSTAERTVDTAFPALTVNATSFQTVKSWTLAAPYWRSDVTVVNPPRKLHVRVLGELFGTANTKTVQIDLGGIADMVVFTAAETDVFEVEATIYLSDLGVQRMVGEVTRNFHTSVRRMSSAGAEAFTADTVLAVKGRVVNAADSIRFDVVELSVAG